MEISIEDIEEAFLLQVDFGMPLFAEYFKSWGTQRFDDILLNKIDSGGETEMWQTLAILKQRLHVYGSPMRQSAIQDLAVILYYQRLQLQVAFQTNDLKALLIFLEINGYLRVPMARYSETSEITNEQRNAIVANVCQIVRGFNIELNLPSNAGYYDKDSLIKYKQGVIDENVSEVYNLIDSMERGGRGIQIAHRIANLMRFLCETSMADYLDFLYPLKMPHMLVASTQWLNSEQLVRVTLIESSENKWLRFEILRQVFKKYRNSEIGEEDNKAVSHLLYRLYQQDNNFFNQAYWYFESSIVFSKSLGRMLTLLSIHQLNSFVQDNFLFRQYNHYFDAKNALLQEFMRLSERDLQVALLSNAYRKWEMFLDNLLKGGDFHTLTPELSDYANYALTYLGVAK